MRIKWIEEPLVAIDFIIRLCHRLLSPTLGCYAKLLLIISMKCYAGRNSSCQPPLNVFFFFFNPSTKSYFFYLHFIFRLNKLREEIYIKNKQNMAEQQRQSLCPRLIDYLAIVGSRSTNIKHSGNGQNPPVQVRNLNKFHIQSENKHCYLFSRNLVFNIFLRIRSNLGKFNIFLCCLHMATFHSVEFNNI